MFTPIRPQKPKFIQNITWFQKLLAGITGTMFLMAWVTMIPFVIQMFSPNYLVALSALRAGMAGLSLVCGCFVGVPQIKGMVNWLVDFYDYYRKFTAIRERGKKDEE